MGSQWSLYSTQASRRSLFSEAVMVSAIFFKCVWTARILPLILPVVSHTKHKSSLVKSDMSLFLFSFNKDFSISILDWIGFLFLHLFLWKVEEGTWRALSQEDWRSSVKKEEIRPQSKRWRKRKEVRKKEKVSHRKFELQKSFIFHPKKKHFGDFNF